MGNPVGALRRYDFLNLARYAAGDLPDDASKQEKFRNGLNTDLKIALAPIDFPDFATLVNKAITVETAHMEHPDSQK